MFRLQHRHRRRARHLIAAILSLVAMSVATMSIPARAETPISFGYASWPGVTVKTKVITNILEAMGYKTTETPGQQVIVLNALTKDIDIVMEAWRPVRNELLAKIMKDGKVTEVRKNLTDATSTTLVVPEYVYQAGVHTMEDLHEFGERFDKTIYTIDAGGAVNTAVTNAIDRNMYNLGDWEDVPASTAGMLAQVKRKIKRDEWVVFTGWKPHWMTVIFDLRFLDDPEAMFAGSKEPTGVYTMANTEFLENNPNVAAFLDKFIVSSQVQSQWIYRYGYENVDAETVARDWIRDNLDLVGTWLEGVRTADGERPAMDAILAEFG